MDQCQERAAVNAIATGALIDMHTIKRQKKKEKQQAI
jgi:hypothetical protein